MNVKSTSLFFILFALAACSRSPAPKTTPQEANAAFNLEVILANTQLTNEAAVDQIIDIVKAFLALDIEFAETGPANRLSSLLAHKDRIFSHLNSIAASQPVQVQTRAEAILDALPKKAPTAEEAAGKEAEIKKEILGAVSQAGQDFLELIRLASLTQLNDQLKQGAIKILVTEYTQNSAKFLEEFKKQLEALSAQMPESIKLSAEFAKEFNSFRKNLVSLTYQTRSVVAPLANMFRNPESFLTSVASKIFDSVTRVAMADTKSTEDVPDRTSQFAAAASRITLIAQAYVEMTQDQEKFLPLVALLQRFTYFAGNIPEADAEYRPFLEHTQYQEFAHNVVQSLFDAMVPVVNPKELLAVAVPFLDNGIEVFTDDLAIRQVIRKNSMISNFGPASDTNKKEDLVQKIRNFDLFAYLLAPAIEAEDSSEVINKAMSEERRTTLINNLAVIHNISKKRLNFAQKLKILLTLPNSLPALSDDDLSNLYELTLDCASTVSSQILPGDHHLIFDQCLDAAFKSKAVAALKDNYLLFKVLNLLFIPADSSAMTVFPSLKGNSAEVRKLHEYIGDHSTLAKHLRAIYSNQSGSHVDLSDSSYFAYFSEKAIPARVFHMLDGSNAVEYAINPIEDAVTNKIGVQFVKDNLEAREHAIGSPSKIIIEGSPVKDHIEPVVSDIVPRVVKGERENFVNEIVGHLPEDVLLKLKKMTVEDFIKAVDDTETVENVEFTNVIVRVTRRDNPCHPSAGRKC